MIETISNWQTLIGGSFAIFAAAAGWFAVQRQMAQARDLAISEIARKHSAARSNLPLALSALSDYAFACAQIIRECYGNMEGNHVADQYDVPEFPTPPIGAIEGLTSIVEHSVDTEIAEVVADLLSEVQVAHARVRRMHIRRERAGLFRSFLDEMSLDFADIHARVDDMFDFARRESERIPKEPSLDSILGSLRQIGFRYYADFDRLEAWVIARYARRAISGAPRSKQALEALERWRASDEEAVLRYLYVEREVEAYVYKTYRYSAVSDAVAYSALDRARS